MQEMVIDRRDADKIKAKRVYLIDDVVSTGGSYRAMSRLVKKVGADVGFAGAVLREGNFDLSDIETKEREIKSLLQAAKKFGCKNLFLVTKDALKEKGKTNRIRYLSLIDLIKS